MPTKEKRRGFGLAIRSFHGKDGHHYIVFKTTKGSFHTFKEVEVKEAARQCGVTVQGTTRQMWGRLWRSAESA
jgi:hypothetical protein